MQLPNSFSPALCAALLAFTITSPQLSADEASNATKAEQDAVDNEIKRVNLGVEGTVEMLPRWELGIGALQLYGKDYPASDNDNDRLFIVPYFIYRGEKIRVGEGGISALAFENSRYSIDFSVAGSVNANSEGNELRDGLPDIDYMFEMGPQLVVTLYDEINSDGSHSDMTLSTQLRAAFSTDFSSVESRGAVLSTSLQWERDGFKQGRYGFFAEIAPKWATEELHDVFYEVEQQYETDTRPSYDAQGGYLGTDVSLGMVIRPRKKLQVFLGLGKQFYGSAANKNSPLFETDSSNTFWAGLTWEFKASETLVPVLRD